MSIAEKRRTFRALHQTGCWVIPNPWNIGTARYLQGLGFKALATTSAGYAHSYGYSDGDVTKDMVLAHLPRNRAGGGRASECGFRERLCRRSR
jgi:2-methylisocitrate lyase-like PEP mutase family enzyme